MTVITKYKRTLTVIAVLLVAYFNFNFSMNYKINQELNKAKKDGQITELSQLMKERVRSDNRAPMYIAAGELADINKDYTSEKNMIDNYQKNKEKLQEDFAKNQVVFDIMDKVSTKHQCNFNLDYEKGFQMLIPNFLQMRTLSQLLALKAFDDIEKGNYDDAVKRCTQCLSFAKDLSSEHGSLIQQMIAICIANIGMEPIKYMVKNKIEANYVPVYNELNNIKSSGMENFIKSIEAERTSGVDFYQKFYRDQEILSFIGCGFSRDNVWFLTLCNIFSIDSNKAQNDVTIFINKTKSFILNCIGKIAKPYILADELSYVKYMNKLVENLKKNPDQQIICPEISKYYILSNFFIPNISKAHGRQIEVITDCSNLINEINNI